MQNIEIDLTIKDNLWKTENIFLNYKDEIKKIVEECLKTLKIKLPKESVIEISFVFTNDQEIQSLNKKYRKKDQPTNVLSFQIIKKSLKQEIAKNPHLLLGDIFISLDTLKQEAEEQSKSIQDHFTHLIIHSFLHLLGYNHKKDKEAEKMEDLEVKILEKLGIANPY